MERRMIYALILSMGVLYLWNVVINPPPPQQPKAEGEAHISDQEKNQDAKAAPLADEEPAPLLGREDEEDSVTPKLLPKLGQKADPQQQAEDAKPSGEAGAPTLDAAAKTEEAPAAEMKTAAAVEASPKSPEELVTLETDLFTAVFTSYGAKLKSLVLKNTKYSKKNVEGEGRSQVNVISTLKVENYPYTLLLGQANFEYSPEQSYKVDSRDANSVSFTTETPQGVKITKRFEYLDNYMFKLSLTFTNDAQASASFFPKINMVSFQDSADIKSGIFGSMPLNQQIPKAFIDGEIYEEMDREELAASVIKKGQILWTAIDDRYFLLSLLPPDEMRSQITIKNYNRKVRGENGEQMDHNWLFITHTLEKQQVMPGKALTLDYKAFVGPKEYVTLTEVGGAERLEEAVDFWVLGFLAKPMLWVMQYSFKLIPNWGIAIIILTIIIKLLLYPLTNKSFQSMQKMKDLKPKIDKLKEKLGEDKQEFNKQMMELYKKEGVNPLGGCLPMLLQMPVYIALYKMLQNSVELYNASFIPGWLTDLVQPDPYYILPVLLAVLMFVQQKLTPTPDSQQQKMMMYMMPAMMFFFMLMLPSGLVLYILANTLVTIGQQWWINKKSQEKKAAAAAKA